MKKPFTRIRPAVLVLSSMVTLFLATGVAAQQAPAARGGASPDLWVHPYVCEDGFFGPLRDDYVKVMADASQWQEVLADTRAVGFHIALLGRYRDKETGKIPYRATDAQLRTLATFYR